MAKTQEIIKTVNQRIVDNTVLRSIQLEQYKNGELLNVIRMLDKVREDLTGKYNRLLKNVVDLPQSTVVKRQKTIARQLAQIDAVFNDAIDNYSGKLKSRLSSLAVSEVDWSARNIDKAMPINVELLTPNLNMIKGLANTRPFHGALLDDWWSSLKRSQATQLRRQIQIGVTQGESIRTISSRIREISKTTARQSEAIVRTAVNNVSTQARLEFNQANTDIIKGEQIIATLDNRTTIICMSLDGKIFPVGEGERPPFHINCRSTVAPVTRSWQELGIPAKELQPSYRESMNGKVAEKITYPQWLKDQPIKVQNEVLGVGKAKLFRDGLPIDKFVSSDLKPLTLKELQALE